MRATELSSAGTVPQCSFTVAVHMTGLRDWRQSRAAAELITAKSFTIDGEAVVLGSDGLSRFEAFGELLAHDIEHLRVGLDYLFGGRGKHDFRIISLVSNFGLLGYFKYSEFLTENLNFLLGYAGLSFQLPPPAAYGNRLLSTFGAPDDWLFENEPLHSSMLRTSVSPNIFAGGYRSNVIPSEAKAIVNSHLRCACVWKFSLPDETSQTRKVPSPLPAASNRPSGL